MTDDPVREFDVPSAPFPEWAPPEPPEAVIVFPVHTSEDELPAAPLPPPAPTVTVTELPPVTDLPVAVTTEPPLPASAFDPVAPPPPPPTRR